MYLYIYPNLDVRKSEEPPTQADLSLEAENNLSIIRIETGIDNMVFVSGIRGYRRLDDYIAHESNIVDAVIKDDRHVTR